MSSLTSEDERLSRTLSLFNSGTQLDMELMEGLKLMMLFRARDLHLDMKEEAEVPTFAWLLFARDTCMDTAAFVTNHLNKVGDSAGVDQVCTFFLKLKMTLSWFNFSCSMIEDSFSLILSRERTLMVTA
jgi:hypothetical protein